MLARLTGIAALAAAAAAPASAASPQPIAGRWVTEDGSALVAIAPCGRQWCGRIERVLKRDPSRPAVDANNPDPALRSRSVIGLPILTGFSAGDGQWDGRIYDPRNGKTYRSVLIREGRTLRVKGCLGPFCRTQRWSQQP